MKLLIVDDSLVIRNRLELAERSFLIPITWRQYRAALVVSLRDLSLPGDAGRASRGCGQMGPRIGRRPVPPNPG